MRVVTLMSGGLDSTLMALLIKEESIDQVPLFINYGQRSFVQEFNACRKVTRWLGLPALSVVDISNWGKTVGSGLTRKDLRIFEDAFLPGRNMMFLLVGASVAYRKACSAVAIGLLTDETTIFPDQTLAFCKKAESLLSSALDMNLKILTPLKDFRKADVVAAARVAQISGTYSCHAGTRKPCGKCVACREYIGIEV
jgi:7-cyano-7-deazaguanine synthase